MDSYDFKATLISFFESDPETSKLLAGVKWDEWFYGPGLPPKPDFDTSLVDVCYSLAEKWESLTQHNKQTTFVPQIDDIKGWSAWQVQAFLDAILGFQKSLSKKEVQKIGQIYGFDKGKNLEVVSRYLRLGLKAEDETIYKRTAEVLASTGRMLYVS